MTTQQDLQAYAQQAAARAGVDPNIFMRMISQESGWNPEARSSAGAIGIAQFMPATAQGMGIDATNPYQSLDAAARYLRSGLDQFGSYPLALAAYNAGAGAVQKYGGIPPYAETQAYVKSILGGQDVTQPTPTDPAATALSALSFDANGTPTGGAATATAAQQIEAVLQELEAQKPDPAVYATYKQGADAAGNTYTMALASWANAVDKVSTAAKNMRYSAMGITKLPDGSVVATGTLDPAQQAQIANANANDYTAILNQYGLDQFNVLNTSAKDTNAALTSDFNNRVASLNAGISLDTHNLASAQAQLQRWLDGQNVATQQVNEQATADALANKWGTTDGQTAFSANDLGAGVSALAAQGGIAGNVPLLKFPGVINVDPAATRAAALATMGVSATAPSLPAPTFSANAVPPQAPQLIAPPQAPQFVPPTPYLPPAAAPAAATAPALLAPGGGLRGLNNRFPLG